jgi:hypothetical protein
MILGCSGAGDPTDEDVERRVAALLERHEATLRQEISNAETQPADDQGDDQRHFAGASAVRAQASWEQTKAQIDTLRARPAEARREAVRRIRSVDQDPDVEYMGQSATPYSASARVEWYRTNNRSYSVDPHTNRIVEIHLLDQTGASAAPLQSPAVLEAKARAVVAQGHGDLDLRSLRLTIGSKAGFSHFFRWTANDGDSDNRNAGFVQVGLTNGGDLVSYVDTLALAQQELAAPPHFDQYYANGGNYWQWLVGSYNTYNNAGYCYIYGWCNPKNFYYAQACAGGSSCMAKGRWVPNLSSAITAAEAFIPSVNATALACYRIFYDGGLSSQDVCINQNYYYNTFATLTSGLYNIQRVMLNNVTAGGLGTVAWDEIWIHG